MSDDTMRDVTSLSQWDCSDRALATVSTTGMLTVISGGDIDVRATYQGVGGSMHLLVSTPASSTVEISGVVTEAAPGSLSMSGVRLQMVSGPAAGTMVTSGPGGFYRFTSVPRGVVAIEATKDGYLSWDVRNLTLDTDYHLDVVLYPTPPTDAGGAAATTRCADGTWSWARTRGEACTVHGGIAYTVCPGVLCNSLTAAAH
jgi:hypothetical protein